MNTKLILISLLCASRIVGFCQNESKLLGIWEGKIVAGAALRVVFHFSKDSSGNLSATMDSPDQAAQNIACDNIRIDDDSIFLRVPVAHATYSGLLTDTGGILGKWNQGISFPLNLKKVDKVTGLNRPQTPIPPFPYSVEDVEYENANGSMHYGATITIPQGKGPFPAVLLITGSGAQNRDEEIMEHKPFGVIADYLSRRGVIVLRVDDRGVGKTSGDFLRATTVDFTTDAGNSVDYLTKRPEVDQRKIGLIGHSEGGMIAPMLAARRKDIDFMILLAGPGEKISKLMEDQNAALYRSVGINEKAIAAFKPFFRKIVEHIRDSKDVATFDNKVETDLDEWRKNTPPAYVLATTRIYDDSSRKVFIETLNATMYSPWFRYFIQFDPQVYLQQLHCKLLALNGERDLQVASKSNLAAIKSAMERAGNKQSEVIEIPGLNHLFQTCKACTVSEYGQLEETFSPVALRIIAGWIDRNVK